MRKKIPPTDKLKIRFTSKWPYNPASLLIARLGGSNQFSHVMAIHDYHAYEATMLHGVRRVPLSDAMEGVKYYQDMYIDIKNRSNCIGWAESQVGRPYDFPGALGLPFLQSDDWSDESKWWCSEYVFMMLGEGGNWVMDKDEKTRVTPNDLHQCNYEKSQIYHVK